ncbi:hypothetical protein CH063_04085 [Colletotrichum higginsianum]|uniref:Uncharacterized protein n=1 Tax=Colletotrichum higginsianum (strain IMI 349063) TaxID=759273 RepID=H1W404_COLHI|nr:hypothetical protein CH063_04085 [Colletotrichum higginsianum]
MLDGQSPSQDASFAKHDVVSFIFPASNLIVINLVYLSRLVNFVRRLIGPLYVEMRHASAEESREQQAALTEQSAAASRCTANHKPAQFFILDKYAAFVPFVLTPPCQDSRILANTRQKIFPALITSLSPTNNIDPLISVLASGLGACRDA